MKIDMEKIEEREPEFAKLDIKGTGVGALVRMTTSFELADAAEGGTAMHWSADVRIAGPVGSMGQRVLQPIVNQQVQLVLAALDREVQNEVAGARGDGDTEAAPAVTGEASPSVSGHAGHDAEPSPDASAPPAEGPTDYGPPAGSTPEPEPPSGTSGADEGVSPWSPEGYEPEPEGPTTSTEDR